MIEKKGRLIVRKAKDRINRDYLLVEGRLRPGEIIQGIEKIRQMGLQDVLSKRLENVLEESWSQLHRLLMLGGYISRDGSFLRIGAASIEDLTSDEQAVRPIFISKLFKDNLDYQRNEFNRPTFISSDPTLKDGSLKTEVSAIHEYINSTYRKYQIPRLGRLSTSSATDQFLLHIAHTHGQKGRY